MFVYVGTFTVGVMGAEAAEGISVFRLDENSGDLSHIQTVPGLYSPSWLALHPTKPLLFTAERWWTVEKQDEGALTSFAIDPRAGTLSQVDRQPSGGDWPAHLSVHPHGNHVFVANARSAHAAVFPIEVDGRILPACAVVQHHGWGPKPRRQDHAYVHAVESDPSGRHLLVCDLGIDRIVIYDFDEARGKLEPAGQPFAQVSSGAGPRHLTFHPGGHLVYLLNELDATLSVFDYDPESAAMEIRQTVAMTPVGYRDRKSGAELAIHPNGRFLYASNRVHNSIAIFSIDPEGGELQLVRHESTRGETPRNFAIEPSGRFMFVGNQITGTIVTFRIDSETGLLEATGPVTSTPCPVSIVFRAEG